MVSKIAEKMIPSNVIVMAHSANHTLICEKGNARCQVKEITKKKTVTYIFLSFFT